MEKIKFLILICIFIFSPKINAQYGYQIAFPNLPNFSSPIEVTNAGDGTNRIFVAQQRGLVYVFNNSPTVSVRKTFINLTSKVSQSGSELGLLGLAFHPDYENNRYFYVDYTKDTTIGGNASWKTIVSRFTTSISNPDTAVLSTEVILFSVIQPYTNHNGGKLAFGNDGYLYISLGDGGSGGDPQGNGQNKSTFLGKILRINVDSAANGNQYSIPTTNPFYGNLNGWKEEIYAYGLRNMWKFSFDYPTDRLWGGDVGQGAYEEIDLIENGKNYGWNKMEGFHCYPSNSCDTTGYGFTRPVWEYNHTTGGISITGGYVYRGSALPGLYGKYIYADYGTGRIWGLTYNGTGMVTNDSLQKTTFSISTFGVDENNELYFCRYSGSLGNLYRLYTPNISTLNLKAIVEGLYDTGNNRLNLRDSIGVFVHQINSPYNVLDSANTVLDSLNFSGLCFFNNTPNGKYYLRLYHRNGLETWSRAGGDSIKKGVTVSYDFTNDSSKAYGNNEIKVGSNWCVYSGELVKDGIIDVSDILDDYDDVLNITTGYYPSDINGDYITDVTDLLIIHNNSLNVVSVVKP